MQRLHYIRGNSKNESMKFWIHCLCYIFIVFLTIVFIGFILDCYSKKKQFNYLCAILADEGIDCVSSFAEMKQDFIQKYPESKENKSETIPFIQHFVHVFGSGELRKVSDYKVIKMMRSINKLNEANPSWQHYIWTNDSSGIPNSILNLSNVKIKYLSELKDNILYQDIVLGSKSSKLIEWVQTSDLVRVAVLQKYGGVYFDCDVEVFRADELAKLMRSFDLVLGQESKSLYISNAIMASVPNHLVMNNAALIMHRNLHQDSFPNIPEYLKDKTALNKVIKETGPITMSVVYYQYADLMKKNGIETSSIVLPPIALSNLELARRQPPIKDKCEPTFLAPSSDSKKYYGIKVNSIAADPLCGTWGFS
jgi:mannosyltransferase OCH1-like enzyme